MWQRGFLVLTVLLGWGAVLLGLYWVFPQQLLAFGSYARGSQPQMLEWKERLSVIAAIVMTMVAHVLIRYKDTEGEQRRFRAAASTLGLFVLLATGIASVIGAWAFR
jgi:hypothetical protein